MIIFLAFQAMIFAAWAVVSFGILFGMTGRALELRQGLPGPAAQMGAARGYLSDPMTALRRRIWLTLTVVLSLCVLVSAWGFTTL